MSSMLRAVLGSLVVGSGIIPYTVDDVGMPWRIVDGIIECKRVLRLRFCAIICTTYTLNDGI